ncbi:hypothetical protein GTW40_08245 [Streptomyces sp. SID4985]|uniref:hypothetical protein n=1 Tax=Streptomyces sp. SID4985 TaxID=2690292 RepID=UPI0013713E85|nr:hypothetical protein [Streptomyces sp. SID4985]MYQ45047.1 hypothetical protein [Streptomyces sp. SID4985]
MERAELERLLTKADDAAEAALSSLRAGASYVIWEGTTPAQPLARTYARRLRLTHRRGTETFGLERAVRLLAGHGGPVRLGRIDSVDGAWIYMVFITEVDKELLACTGVRRKQP